MYIMLFAREVIISMEIPSIESITIVLTAVWTIIQEIRFWFKKR